MRKADSNICYIEFDEAAFAPAILLLRLFCLKWLLEAVRNGISVKELAEALRPASVTSGALTSYSHLNDVMLNKNGSQVRVFCLMRLGQLIAVGPG